MPRSLNSIRYQWWRDGRRDLTDADLRGALIHARLRRDREVGAALEAEIARRGVAPHGAVAMLQRDLVALSLARCPRRRAA
jgi:hypothetical protein